MWHSAPIRRRRGLLFSALRRGQHELASQRGGESDVDSNEAAPSSVRYPADLALVLGSQEVSMSQAKANGGVKNVVLVHGGFVDGSGWQGVYDTLKKDGYTVSIVQN